MAFALAFASRLKPEAAAACVVLGVLLIVGLHWDALKQQRDANDLLVEALADGRVKAPSIEGAESKAKEISRRSATDERKAAVIDTDRAMSRAVTLASLISSEPTRIYAARDAVVETRKKFDLFKSGFSEGVIERGEQTLAALEEVTSLWVAAWEQTGAPDDNWAERSHERGVDAIGLYEAFRVVMREELNRLRTEVSLALPTQAISQEDGKATQRPSTVKT